MQSRTRKGVALLFALAALAAVVFAVHLSRDPDYYFFYEPEDRSSWTYNSGAVAFVCAAMLVEAFGACFAIVATRPKTLGARCLIGLLILGPLSLFSTMFVVHMPVYVLFHHLWAWLLVLVLMVVGAASAIRRQFLRSPGRAA